ncbi:MAG TPA: hypothetical protein VH333_12985 [Pseudonocardiaceae bacterium]|jgi:hypothetical protein|nr:hypothetical protein [Pseudonocardiaceae bacterium]
MRTVIARLGAGVATAGLAVLVIGTFLPWLRSGTVLRDSYQSAGALRGLVSGLNAQAGAVLGAWPAVIPCCAVCVAGYALGLRRSAAIVGLLVALVVGTAAGVIAVQGDATKSVVGPADTGPIVTLVGATIMLAGAITVVVCPRAGRWGGTGGGSS